MQTRTVRQRSLRSRVLPLALLLPLLAGGCATLGSEQKPAFSSEPSVNLMRLARTAEAKGDLRSAAALYQQAHIIDPSTVAPLLALGASLRGQGEDGEAVEAYRRALAIDPRNTEALRGIGMAQIGLEQARAALDSFNSALHIDSRDARSWNGRGVALDMQGRHSEAQDAYRTGLSLKQGDAALRNNLGLSLSLAAAAGPAAARTEAVPAARANLAQATPTPPRAAGSATNRRSGGWSLLQ